jgi:hypothetical protein
MSTGLHNFVFGHNSTSVGILKLIMIVRHIFNHEFTKRLHFPSDVKHINLLHIIEKYILCECLQFKPRGRVHFSPYSVRGYYE